MLNNDLNLKTEIKIGENTFPFELYTIDRGVFKEIKFNNQIFQLKDNGQGSFEQTQQKPEQSIEKTEQTPIISEQKTKKSRKGRKWTKKEDSILLENYQSLTAKQIEDKKLLPGRTWMAIHCRINRLNALKTTGNNVDVEKPSSSNNIIISDNQPVKGFQDHVNKRSQEIKDRLKNFKSGDL